LWLLFLPVDSEVLLLLLLFFVSEFFHLWPWIFYVQILPGHPFLASQNTVETTLERLPLAYSLCLNLGCYYFGPSHSFRTSGRTKWANVHQISGSRGTVAAGGWDDGKDLWVLSCQTAKLAQDLKASPSILKCFYWKYVLVLALFPVCHLYSCLGFSKYLLKQ
jgi:hypothetical protein